MDQPWDWFFMMCSLDSHGRIKDSRGEIPIALVMGTNTGWLVTRFTIGYHTRSKAWYCTTRTSKDEGDETEGPSPFFLLIFFFSFFLYTTTSMRVRKFPSHSTHFWEVTYAYFEVRFDHIFKIILEKYCCCKLYILLTRDIAYRIIYFIFFDIFL